MRSKTNILQAAAAMMVAVALLLFASCQTGAPREREPVTLASMGIRPDSLISPGITAIINGENIEITSDKSCYRLAIKPLDTSSLYIDSSDSLLCLIFNRRVERHAPCDTLPAAFAPVYNWLISSVTERELPMMHPSQGCNGYKWPVEAINYIPALASFDYADMTGDDVLRARCATQTANLLTQDDLYARDPSTGLYRGASAGFISLRRPEANAAQYAATYSLSSNIERIALMHKLAEATGDTRFATLADSLAIAVETIFRLPTRGAFCEALYEVPYPITFNGCDNLAQALAVVLGTLRPEVAEMLTARAPLRIEREGNLPALASFWPEINDLPASYRDLNAALWSIAGARMRNQQVFALAFGNLAHRALADSCAAEMLRGAVIRGIFGIKPMRGALSLSPYNPTGLSDRVSLHNFRYRNATLDIHLSGNGDIISTVTLDGEVIPTAEIPETLTGRHEVHIRLVGESPTSNDLAEAPAAAIPKLQEINVTDNSTLRYSGAERYAIYVNGRLETITASDIYDFANEYIPGDPMPEFISVVPLGEDDSEGFSPGAFIYTPDKSITTISADKVATPGTRAFKDKKLDRMYGREFVESTHHRNPVLRFRVNSKSGGKAYISIVYVDGLGIVNPGLRYALRSVEVNGRYAGLVVFPQLNPDRWDHRVKWWERQAETLPIEVDLQPGDNNVTISYFAPPATELLPDANILLPIAFKIIMLS